MSNLTNKDPRHLVLKGLFDIINDPKGVAEEAAGFDEQIEAQYKALIQVFGKQKCEQFLASFSKGLMYQVVNFIDEGNVNMEKDGFSWRLFETDEKEQCTNKPIGGLHEDFEDLNLSL